MLSYKPIALSIISALALTACGSSASSNASPATSKMPSSSVFSIQTNKTAQIVAQGKSARFTITALTKNNKPATGEPVTFYVGIMTPLSQVPPSKWLSSGSTSASSYISSFSKKTNSSGQASITLKGQPLNTMEMIGLKVGSLSSYVSGKGAIGSLDAWWTTPSATPAMPVGNYVKVDPFMAVSSAKTDTINVTVGSTSGVIKGAKVQFIPKINPQKSSSMSSMSSMTTSGASSSMMTNSSGKTTYMLQNPSMTTIPIRIVVTQNGSQRVAGGMNILFKS